MRERFENYRNLTNQQKKILNTGIEDLSSLSNSSNSNQNLFESMDVEKEMIKFDLYKTLLKEYIGDDRKEYLHFLLEKNTYIITLNSSVDMVYGVLRQLNPGFEKSRVHSVRNSYDNFLNFYKGYYFIFKWSQSEISLPELALIIKLGTILKILKDGEKGLFVDDMFTEELFEKVKKKIMLSGVANTIIKNLDYFHVDPSIMNGVEEEYIAAKGININEYHKLFLDFDETITTDNKSLPIINGKEYTYSNFLELSLQ